MNATRSKDIDAGVARPVSVADSIPSTFVRSKIRGVLGIVCKVRSLEEARRYLKNTKSYGRVVDGRIELDKSRTCGLSIYLTEV